MSKVHFGLGLFVGLIIGGGGIYLFMRDIVEQEISEETENVRKYYKEKYENALKSLEDEVNAESKQVAEEELNQYHDITKMYDYSSISVHGEVMNPPEDEEDMVEIDHHDEINVRSDSPYIIDRDTFETTCRDYFKEDYTYYPDDKTMVDRRGKGVDMSSVSSDDIIKLLNNPKTSEVLVRNDMLQMDFDIIIDRVEYM